MPSVRTVDAQHHQLCPRRTAVVAVRPRAFARRAAPQSRGSSSPARPGIPIRQSFSSRVRAELFNVEAFTPLDALDAKSLSKLAHPVQGHNSALADWTPSPGPPVHLMRCSSGLHRQSPVEQYLAEDEASSTATTPTRPRSGRSGKTHPRRGLGSGLGQLTSGRADRLVLVGPGLARSANAPTQRPPVSAGSSGGRRSGRFDFPIHRS